MRTIPAKLTQLIGLFAVLTLIINVGTATLGTFIGAGGLGESINNAIRLDRTVVLVTASGVTAIVALFVDWLAGVAEDVLRPRGL